MNQAELQGEVITEDVSCHSCGYSLKGLPVGGNCPECGTVVANAAGRKPVLREPEWLGKPLIEAPRWYLVSLFVAFIMMTVSWMVMPAIMLAAGLLFFFKVYFYLDLPHPQMRLGLAMLWAGGVLITLLPRPLAIRGKKNGEVMNEVPRLRSMVLAAQVPIVLAPLFDVISLSAINPTPWQASAFFLTIFAVLGYIPTALYLSKIAEWARDDELSEKLRAYGWLIGFGAFGAFCIYASLEFQNVIPILPFIASIFWLFVVATLVISSILLAVSTIKLADMARWLLINRESMLERDRRLAQKAAAEAAKHQREAAALREATMDIGKYDTALYDSVIAKHEAQADQPKSPSSTPEGFTFANEHRIEKKEDNPYGIEDDDEAGGAAHPPS